MKQFYSAKHAGNLFGKIIGIVLVTVALFANPTVNAQQCTNGLVYTIMDNGQTDRKDLYLVNSTTGATTFVANAFSCGPTNTMAIALHNTTNTIWIASRGSSGVAPRIYSYKLPSGPCTDVANFSGLGAGTSNLKMAAYNPRLTVIFTF